MGMVIGESSFTKFSYIEYQALMLVLAGLICMGFVCIEIFLNRFQVLPLLFPGMFSIRERRFYFFDFEVDDVGIGQKLRAEAKMLARLTLCVVFSYLWQHCVLETEQIVGTEFPQDQCGDNKDCFASELHFLTLVNRQHTAVNCNGDHADFPSRVVVSCIRFIQPSASLWLMHLAISHSVTQLNLKCYELFTWTAGNYPFARHALVVLTFISLCLCLSLFFSGVMSEFVSSWLSFVMSLSIPIFLITVYKSAKIFEDLHVQVSKRVHERIEKHLETALADFDVPSEEEGAVDDYDTTPRHSSLTGMHLRFKISKSVRSASSHLMTRVLPVRQTSADGQGAPAAVTPQRSGEGKDGPEPLAAVVGSPQTAGSLATGSPLPADSPPTAGP